MYSIASIATLILEVVKVGNSTIKYQLSNIQIAKYIRYCVIYVWQQNVLLLKLYACVKISNYVSLCIGRITEKG